jgi:hypothetical protein
MQRGFSGALPIRIFLREKIQFVSLQFALAR